MSLCECSTCHLLLKATSDRTPTEFSAVAFLCAIALYYFEMLYPLFIGLEVCLCAFNHVVALLKFTLLVSPYNTTFFLTGATSLQRAINRM